LVKDSRINWNSLPALASLRPQRVQEICNSRAVGHGLTTIGSLVRNNEYSSSNEHENKMVLFTTTPLPLATFLEDSKRQRSFTPACSLDSR